MSPRRNNASREKKHIRRRSDSYNKRQFKSFIAVTFFKRNIIIKNVNKNGRNNQRKNYRPKIIV